MWKQSSPLGQELWRKFPPLDPGEKKALQEA